MSDYRKTNYCVPSKNIGSEKENIKITILKKHPKATNHYNYICKNDDKYKDQFMDIYNNKCSYCGISIDLIDKLSFEIDHFVYKKSNHDINVNDVSNLVLSCRKCNKAKLDFDVIEKKCDHLHPDGEDITRAFFRDYEYYIKVSDDFINNPHIEQFYKKLRFDSEIHRLDYLLMSLIGFCKKYEKNKEIYGYISEIISILRNKRNKS